MSTAVRVQNRLSDPNIKPGNGNVNLGHNSTTTNENGIDINNDISRAVLPPKSTTMQFLRVFSINVILNYHYSIVKSFYEIILSLYMENLMNQYHLPPTILKLINHFNSSSSDGDKTLVGLMFINQRFNNF